jgi:glycosyltransferase involved in cell wall biosynthesis
MSERRVRIMSTLFSTDPPMPAWERRVDMLSVTSGAAGILTILRRARHYSIVVLDGSGRRDQIAAMLLRLLRPRLPLVITDSTWKRERDWRNDLLNRLGIRLIDGPRTTFCVHSRFEVDTFPRTWGPLHGRVCFTPWPWTLKQPGFGSLTSDSGRVFAGGNSLRDYDQLIEAARSLSASIDIVTNALSADQRAACPPNVDARPLPPDEYDRLLFAAAVVVVPLLRRDDRSSGQTTYVNAMALGKAIVVTDTPGVRDYITDGETGVIVAPGDAGAMAAAVQRLIDDPESRRHLGSRAREHALGHLSLTDYALSILQVVDSSVSLSL